MPPELQVSVDRDPGRVGARLLGVPVDKPLEEIRLRLQAEVAERKCELERELVAAALKAPELQGLDLGHGRHRHHQGICRKRLHGGQKPRWNPGNLPGTTRELKGQIDVVTDDLAGLKRAAKAGRWERSKAKGAF